AATTGLAIEGESGGSVRVTTRGVHVEHAGRLRACVRVDADATIGGTRRVEFIARVEFFAGHGSVRVRITVRNPDRAVHPGNYWDLGDPGSILIRDCTLTIARPEEAAAAAEVSLEAGQPATRVALPFELYQDSSGGEYWNSTNHINRNRVVPNTFRGYRARAGNETTSGLRATPIVTVGDGAGAVTVALPGFWQNFPRA